MTRNEALPTFGGSVNHCLLHASHFVAGLAARRCEGFARAAGRELRPVRREELLGSSARVFMKGNGGPSQGVDRMGKGVLPRESKLRKMPAL